MMLRTVENTRKISDPTARRAARTIIHAPALIDSSFPVYENWSFPTPGSARRSATRGTARLGVTSFGK
jgi:hypothetical protein